MIHCSASLVTLASIWVGIVGTGIGACDQQVPSPAPSLSPSESILVEVRASACRKDAARVLQQTSRPPIEPAAAIVMGRYRSLALSTLGRREELAEQLTATRRLEARFPGPLPTELGLEYGEVAFWTSADEAVEHLYRALLIALDTHAENAAPDSPEPDDVGIPGCAEGKRRTLAQARALTRLRLGTIAGNLGRLAAAETMFGDGVRILEHAGQIPDEYQGRSYTALLHNNWAAVLLRYGDSDLVAHEKRLLAYRFAEQAGAKDTLGLVSAGLAFLGGKVVETGGGWIPYLTASCIAERRTRASVTAAGSVPSLSSLATLAKALAVRQYYEAHFWGPMAALASDIDFEEAAAIADSSEVLSARQFVWFYRAKTLAAQGRWPEASTVYRMFLDSVALLWATQSAADFQVGMFRNVQHWIDDTLEAGIRNADLPLVLAAMERSKDVGLLLRYTWGIDDASRATAVQLSAPADTGWGRGLLPIAADSMGPDFAAKPESVATEDMEELQHEVLTTGEALLHIDLLRDPPSLVFLLVTRDGAHLAMTDARDIGTRVQHYRQAIANPGEAPETLRAAAQKLYRDLIVPMEAYLKQAQISRLVLVPRGELHSLPWATLVSGDTYLVEQYSLTVAPSAAVFKACRQPGPHPDSGLALVVGAHFDPQAERRLLGGDHVFLGHTNPAVVRTVQDFRQGISAEIVHVKAHASFNSTNPSHSTLFLVPHANLDGHLSLAELATVRIETHIVVLQSCETARTEASPGDQMDSFARAFLMAGARGVVAPLWDLPEATSRQMTPRFYDYLKKWEMDPAKALQQIQIDMLRGELGDEMRSPTVWGIYGFTGGALSL